MTGDLKYQLKVIKLRHHGGYAQINLSRQVCPKCGHKTSIHVKAEGRFCTYPDCNWKLRKESIMTYRVVKRKSDNELLDVALIDSSLDVANALAEKLNGDRRRTRGNATFLVEKQGD